MKEICVLAVIENLCDQLINYIAVDITTFNSI